LKNIAQKCVIYGTHYFHSFIFYHLQTIYKGTQKVVKVLFRVR